MITQEQIRTAVHDGLKAKLPAVVSVYTGIVPDALHTYADGSIKPYIGLWVSNPVGNELMEAIDDLADVSSHRLRIQTQIVAATEQDVYETADYVTAALTNLVVGSHTVKPDSDQHRAAYIITDTTAATPVPYLPLFWELETQ